MKLIIILVAVITLSGCGALKNLAGNEKGFAYIYENRETGVLLFCINNQGNNVRDFKFVGTGKVNKSKIKYCALEKN